MRRLSVAVVVTVLLTACSGPASGPDIVSGGATNTPSTGSWSTAAATGDDEAFSPTDADYAAVTALMKRRAKAINRGDEAAFRATVDPENPDFVRDQVAEFERMRDFGLTDVRYGVDHYGYGDPSVPGGDPGMRPGTYEHAALRGIWKHRVGNRVDLTYVRRDGEWFVAAETPPSIDDQTHWVQARPWAGRVVVERHDGLLVVADAEDADRLDQIAATVDDDLGFVRDLWGVQADNALLVDASSTGSRTMINELGEDGAAAGAVTQTVFDTRKADLERTRLAGFLIKINPGEVDAYEADDLTLEHVLRHELTHYALRAVGGPLWLTEGLAEYAGYRDFGPSGLPSFPRDYLEQARAETDRDELVISSKFNTYPDAGYLQGFLAVHYLVGRFGPEAVLDFARSYGRVGADRGDGRTAKLLDRAFDLTPEAVARAAYASYDTLLSFAR